MCSGLVSPVKVVRFSGTAEQLHLEFPSRHSGATLGHAALDHTHPTTHAYIYIRPHSGGMAVWWYGGMVVPGFALALVALALALSWLSLSRVSLSAPSCTPIRLFARACVSVDDPDVIIATADTLRHSESIVQGAHGGSCSFESTMASA